MVRERQSGADFIRPSLGAPDAFDGYVLERLLGRGGMGEVYLARDTLLDRQVAIKLIASGGDEEARQRFLVEARAVARLEHPNVVGVYRVGEVAGLPYLVSEFVRGTPLDRIARPVDGDTALRIAIDLASGLATAHRRGVLHRDIKPANAILSEDGAIKLLDFGIAKLLEARHVDPSRISIEPKSCRPPAPTGATRIEGASPPATAATRIDGASPSAPTGATRIEGVPARERAQARSPKPDVAPLGRSCADLTRTGVALGTPRYMAPEVWRGEPATFASDVYSLGAMLFFLCAGRPVYPTRDIEALRRAVLENEPEPLASVAPGIDERFCAIVDRCLKRDPRSRYPSAGELRAAFSALMPGARDTVVPDGNPYRGLSSFEAEHKNLYFGRDSEARLVLDRLARDGFVLVAGDSGVGKSSLCRAGVAPRLDAWLKDRSWTTLAWVPGPHPVASLAAVLHPVLALADGEAALASEIAGDPAGVARALRARAGEGGGFLLLVDQLEELVTLAEPSEAAAVAELLGWLALPAAGARLLATVRSDFLSRLAQLPRLGDLVGQALFFLRPLSEERIREAIVGPAAAKNVVFASPEVVDELVRSTTAAGDGALPLLQFALAELWEARGTQPITAATLAERGGVDGALCRHADEVVASLPSVDRQATRRVLSQLVTADGTRARKREEELGTGLTGALAALVRGRLLVARDSPEGTLYEIAHEALITHWQTLRAWLSSDEEARALADRLDAAVAEWERLDRADDALIGARSLDEIARLGIALDGKRAALVEASRRRLKRRRWTRWLAIVGIPLLALAVAAGMKLRAHRALGARIDGHRAAAAAVLERAAETRGQSEAARAEALAAFDRADPQAEPRWDDHLALVVRLREHQGRAAQHLEQALTLDMTRDDIRGDFADLIFAQVQLAERDGDPARRDELLRRLAVFDDDGSRRARWIAPATLRLDRPASLHRYEPKDGRLSPVLVADSVTAIEVPPGSYLAVAGAVRLPFVAHRGETLSLSLAPPRAPIPEGFVYVPPGRFLLGSAADDVQRRDFFHAVPLHEVSTEGFFVARHETTFADWIAFLEALDPAAREQHRPRVGQGGFKGSLTLTGGPGDWRLVMQPTTVALEAHVGEPIRYPGRERLAEHDWLAMPVVGITGDDAQAYVRWLDESGRVAGARLCDERQWERAARGADGRAYPHGSRLRPDEANHDATYQKRAEAMGPDAVGSHPASESPFGLQDASGNVWEWTRSSRSPTGYAARGGSWYFGPSSSHLADREETEASFRDVSVGLRVCADAG